MVDCIIDGGSLWARSYFAAVKCGKDPVALATRTTLNMMRGDHAFGRRVDRAMVCWDGMAKTKKKRVSEKPGDYAPLQESYSKQIQEMIGLVSVKLDDYEADDVVASASEQSTAGSVIVVSGDKDLTQLQCERVAFYDLHQKMVLSRRAICSRFFVHHPIQISLALAIQGDTGDGIHGVVGWGPGRVKKLFSEIDSETPFDKVVDYLLSKMNENQQKQFLECLEVTLLRTDIEGVPEAAQIALNTSLVAEFESTSQFSAMQMNSCSAVQSFNSRKEAEDEAIRLELSANVFPCSACLRWHMEPRSSESAEDLG